ncbi:hypothetical protein CS062_21235 [Roseateles chitinivorans]|uniref:Uncharacterized protein n=1 Tax=Roseateles chitinivorans TaxID=2917965 RepID=A0A2G9C445_9BURK|nr:hypothetical protein [Roseateles chitinivorans]PIM51158.1 hypothetical protein CS062_21235 [Roseateles chitinivorans]
MTFTQLVQACALVVGALTFNSALAHGAGEPRHGGIVQVANDVNFELVVDADGATLYLVDHDEPMSSKGISGKLTVLQGAKKVEVDVKEAGDNELRAIGVKIGKGDKVVAVLNNVEGKTATVRFSIK